MIEKPPGALTRRLSQINRDAEERDAERRAKAANLGYANLSKVPVGLEAIRLVPEAQAREALLAAIELKTHEVALAVYNPKLPAVGKVLAELERKKFAARMFVVSKSSLEQAWLLYKYVSAEAKEITGRVEIEKKHFEELLSRLSNLPALKMEMEQAIHATTTALLEVVLAGALNNRASDIHFEAEQTGARLRFRLDGLLHDIYENLPVKNYESLITRIKLLSSLKINIHGEPQDGRFTINLPSKEVEVRVSLIPSEFGETIVMRLLDPDSIRVNLAELGLRADDLAIVRKILQEPNGLVLNTGPTGSGKTTTLYAFLQELNDPEVKIITIEDPIEYRIGGIEQTQANPEVGYTFANGLRAILRQDPDVVLVGEIRDKETADIALQASLTGHLVLSTLHTNDAVGAVPRLVDLGVKVQTVGSSLSLVIAQRLVRRLCAECKKPAQISPEEKARIEAYLAALPARVDKSVYRDVKIFEPVGCAACNNLGYKGRVAIFEFLIGGPEMEKTILSDASEVALRALAKSQGMVGMQADGVLKVISGMTSFREVEKATGGIVWEAGTDGKG